MRPRAFGRGGPEVPVIGQGTWKFPAAGAGAHEAVAALRAGVAAGLTHIDSAEMYGEGRSEELIAEAIAGLPRAALFIVSKVLPSNASAKGTIRACEQSLRRLRTDYLDVYLLHWRGRYPLAETMGAFERLVDDGKIRALGVSNFDVDDLREAQAALRKHPLACNQVLYHLGARGVEHALIPYCARAGIAVVGYSPFGAGDFPDERSPGGRALAQVAQRYDKTPRQVALAFLTRLDGTFTIPKAARSEHARENAGGDFTLDDAAVGALEAAFGLPPADAPLEIG